MGIWPGIRTSIGNRKGSAFMLALLVFLVLLVMGIGILGMSATNAWMSDADRGYQSAFYIAESGRDIQVAEISKVIEQLSDESDDADEFYASLDQHLSNCYPMTVSEFDSQFGNVPQSVVSIEGIGERPSGAAAHTYTLVSEGQVGGARRRVASELRVTWVETSTGTFEADVALFAIQDIELTGSSRIVGPAGTNATGEGDVSFGWSTSVTGDLYINPAADPDTLINTPRPGLYDNIGGNVRTMPHTRTYELPPYPATPSLPQRSDIELAWDYDNVTISQDGYYGEIKTNCYTLNIYVGSGVRRLVVDDFIINGSGRVNIIGTGKLELWVNRTFTLTGSSVFNPGGDRDKVVLYYGGTAQFRVDGATVFEGSVYVRTADIAIEGSGGVKGHIVSGGANIEITGNAGAIVRVIYAPLAYVHLSGSGRVTGSVIAHHCRLEGDTSITYNAAAGAGGIPIEGFGAEGEATVTVTKAIEKDF